MKVNHAKRLDAQDHQSLVLWAEGCAEHVFATFEEKCPKDNRPRKAIEAGRAWVRGEIAMSEARAAFAAHAAARAADMLLQPLTSPAIPSRRQLRRQRCRRQSRCGTRLAVPMLTNAPSVSGVSCQRQ